MINCCSDEPRNFIWDAYKKVFLRNYACFLLIRQNKEHVVKYELFKKK